MWHYDQHWLVMAMGELAPFSRVLQPLEITWGFGCPLVGKDPHICVELLLTALQDTSLSWQMVMLSGISEKSSLWQVLSARLKRSYSFDIFEGADSSQSDLVEGADAFLARRSKKFRANLRRSERQAAQQGVTYEYVQDFSQPHILFERLMAVERNSWKYHEGRSIFLMGRYRAFYEKLLLRLASRQRLRLLFLQQDNQDVAYVFGGVLGSVYRGFQLGYDNKFASWSLGNLAQWAMIQHLAQESIQTYDLGMLMDYKERWADQTLELKNVVIFSPHL